MLLSCLMQLAQLPDSAIYVDPVKLVAVLLLFVLWTLFAQWVDKDTVAVNTYRTLWNLVVLGGGVLGLGLVAFVSRFAVGFALYMVIELTVAVIYVVHRNSLVRPEHTILTAAHWKRIQQQGLFGKKKVEAKEVKERVRITTAAKKVLAIPEDEIEREKYRLTQDLLWDVFWRRAAMVDVLPAGQATRISYLIDGIPTEREGLTRPEGDAVIQYLKEAAGLSLEERRKPQRGKLQVAIGDNRYTVVIQTSGTTAGERLRLRVVGPEGSYKVKDLGLTEAQLQQVRSVMELPRGLILITGPPASGVTTSVYSFVRSHDAFLQNIQLLEYDREVEVDNVTQHLHTPGDDRTFASDLQRLVRSDPDIIVFPEMREREAAALATKAAAEKTKVYVAHNADDVFDAIKKWTALVGDKGLVAKGLAMVTNQRLVRRLCSECKQPYKPDAETLRKLNMPPDAVLYRPPPPQYDKRGNLIVCQACQGTGYVGRVGVFDLLVIDQELRQVIRSASTIAEVAAFAKRKGGLGLQAQAMHKVLDGTTSIQEVVRVLKGSPAGAGRAAEPGARPQSSAPRG